MPEEISFSRFGKIGFMLLISLLILLLGATMGVIIGSKTRIKQLEDRVVKLEKIDKRVTQLYEQVKAFDQFKERFDRSEAFMLLRTDQIANDLNKLANKIGHKSLRNIEFSRSSKVSKKSLKKRYHTVRAGETLYSISHRYGLSVEKIRLLNNLSDRFVIHPGQKLLIAL